jgi:UDPglucose 6-dehydrogenase
MYATNAIECLEGADCCILVTEWPEFKMLRPEDFLGKMRQPLLIDGRRIFYPDEFANAGIRVYAVGLGTDS